MRSVQIKASTQLLISVSCLAVAGTGDTMLMLCLFLDFTPPPSCLPLHGFTSHAFHGRDRNSTMSCPHHLADRSPCLFHHTFPTFHPQPRDVPQHRFNRLCSACPCRASFGLLHEWAGSSKHPAESSSSSYADRWSFPVAIHPTSQRLSYLQLRDLSLPRNGLAPCWYDALSDV